MRECTLLPGQVLVIADSIHLTVLSIQGDDVCFGVTPEDTDVALTDPSSQEMASEERLALLSVS